MTLKRRIDRLERVNPVFYSDVPEIPMPLLEAMLRRACTVGDWPTTPDDKVLQTKLAECGIQLKSTKGQASEQR